MSSRTLGQLLGGLMGAAFIAVITVAALNTLVPALNIPYKFSTIVSATWIYIVFAQKIEIG
jgi:hypothetical protein